VQNLLAHLHQEHQVSEPREGTDYHLHRQRQCDYCLEEYVDTCTKCAHDFCRLHEGFIHGLCGGCI
jgi:hypothetical protein